MSIVKCEVYSLKWDENGLRDKTLNEIKKDINSNSNSNSNSNCQIKCQCLDRTYNVTVGSIIKHFSTSVHKDWVNIKKHEHIKEFGSCCSPIETVDFLLKENRELKKLIVRLTNQNKIFEETIYDFKRNISELSLKSSIEDNTLHQIS
jgi:hypothetical protein